MPSLKFSIKPTLLVILFCCWVTCARGQDQQRQQTQNGTTEIQEEDTLRISTALIQTGVTVFDKQGRFVDRLGKEDFELRVDGHLVPVSFFERIKAKGSEAESIERDNAGLGSANEPAAAGRGRTVIFFVDDLHLSQDSTKRARDLIRRFIDREAEPDDLAAIASSSGKIGFLQQFTNDAAVLRAATERLRYNRDMSASDRQYPTMSEYEALLIDRNDSEVLGKFIGIYLKEGLALDADEAANEIHSRARSILQEAAIYAKNTYAALELLVRRSAQIPGRKIVFFVSDGFFLDTVNTDASYQLRRITDAAARANAVIYSFDAKGLDASLPDGTAATFRTQSGERWEFQDPLNALARDTGGRFIHNTNDLGAGVTKALEETSLYYLLAWQPDPENRGQDKFRNIEVGVKGRPDLLVRVQRGYLDEAAPPGNAQGKTGRAVTAAPPTPESQLRAAFNSMLPRRALPTSLVVNYLESPLEGPLVVLSIQIESDAVKFTATGEKVTADVDVVGAIFNSTGKREAYFNNRLTVNRPASGPESSDHSDIYYNSQTKLKPGLYQVR
ncbi:MAG TPA: VWA domain-containing protein, partial [Pyrinomonadaceae bacterium]|nr:VWA domain-containing protein [Pyrinomonadaceae bacterium]